MKSYYISTMVLVFFSCWGQVDKNKLLGRDYRLFEGTPVWKLAKAVKSNDVEEVGRIVKNGSVDLNYQEPKFGQSLIMLTILNNQYAMCKKLLELGADPNLHDFYDGTSAIIQASDVYTELRDTTFIKLLLTYGADPNDQETIKIRDGKTGGTTPLLSAASQSLEKVKTLVNAGAHVNPVPGYTSRTPLTESLIMGRYDISMYLLEKGADYKQPIARVNPQSNQEPNFIYVQDLLREKIFPLNSEKHLWKMKIVDFLLLKGIDYRKVTIPDFVVKKVKEIYPENWKEYLEKY